MAIPVQYPEYEVVSLIFCLLLLVKSVHLFFTMYSHYKVSDGLLDPSERTDLSNLINNKFKGANNMIQSYKPKFDNRLAKIGFGL
jgi:hypothetical protein